MGEKDFRAIEAKKFSCLYYGDKWNAFCDPMKPAAAPSEPCATCDEPISIDDSWVEMFHISTDAAPRRLPHHWECHLRSSVGSVGHQQKKCLCYGGTEDDPPGLTKHEAALAAAALFLKQPRLR